MHGMINRALQGFLVDTYGHETWMEVCDVADLRFTDFESMLVYDDQVTRDCLNAAIDLLHVQPEALLEDLGAFLVTNPNLDPVRRLLRFGGATFSDFVMSLSELEERARLAIPDMEMPQISVTQETATDYVLKATWKLPGIAPILLGALRGMADDYGALAVLSMGQTTGRSESVRISVLDTHHAEGRSFVLAEVDP